MVFNYEYSTYKSHHNVLVNLQASNMDALKNQNYGLCWPTQSICYVWKNIQQTVYYAVFKLLPKAALTTETKQRKTIPKQIQNNVLFQTLLHVKQNDETIPKRFGIVLELFQSCFRLMNIFMHMSKNMQIPKQFQRSQPITDDHSRITLY